MEVIYHPLVRQDLVEMLRYYRKISQQLEGEIYAEFRRTIDLAAETPLRFPPADRDFRRANLTRFPYHILYEAGPGSIRVMLIRHHKRHPQFGLERT